MSLKNWNLCDLHIHRYLLLYIKMKNAFIFFALKYNTTTWFYDFSCDKKLRNQNHKRNYNR